MKLSLPPETLLWPQRDLAEMGEESEQYIKLARSLMGQEAATGLPGSRRVARRQCRRDSMGALHGDAIAPNPSRARREAILGSVLAAGSWLTANHCGRMY